MLFLHMLVLPFINYWVGLSYGGLLLLCSVGGSVYCTFFRAYSPKSKYSYLGAIRAGVQRISYEVCLFLLIFALLRLGGSCHLVVGGRLLCVPLLVLTFFAILSELGRSPFDFTEGESELVSGYNLEFGRLLFIYLFLSEYGSIFFFSCVIASSFWSWSGRLGFSPLFFLYLFLLCRAALPRYRYDMLMAFFWRLLLPIRIQLFVLYYLFGFYEGLILIRVLSLWRYFLLWNLL